MTARFFCAASGVAVAVGTVVFMSSLMATNDAQAPALAAKALASYPVPERAEVCTCTVDYRPGGRVLQGPPMRAEMACVTTARAGLPDDFVSGRPKVAVTPALFGWRAKTPPPVGSTLRFVGENGTMTAEIAAILPLAKSIRGLPNVFCNPAARKVLAEETWRAYEPPSVEAAAASFVSDAGRNLGRAKPLLLWGAALTALCLLVNSLFLSIEARRRTIAILRTVGLTRAGVARLTFRESCALTAAGTCAGLTLSCVALAGYVAFERELFPCGLKMAWGTVGITCVAAFAVAAGAALLALGRALTVRPLEAASAHVVRKRPYGMLLAFAFGYGSFVAVEVWGSSLMRAFTPSAEWPDAIVSILPGGVELDDFLKVKDEKGVIKIPGVREIHELAPLQVPFSPLEEMKMPFGKKPPAGERPPMPPGGGKPPMANGARPPMPPGGGRPPMGRMGLGRGMRAYENVLLMASDWLPPFKFTAGDRATALEGMKKGGCVITEMMSAARHLNLGDRMALDFMGKRRELPVVGIVDLNWHLVTSRGLVRGLNRMPGNTSGPAFIDFDTFDALDPRPPEMVRTTHLWLDYEPDFLEKHGVFAAGRRVEADIARALGFVPVEDPAAADAATNGKKAAEAEGPDRGLGSTVRLHARDEIADGTLAHGDHIIGAMARVPFIFIAVLSLGFIAALVAAADVRRREYAILRTVGATRLQLAGRLAAVALKTAAGGLALGLAGGALAGWLFTFVTRTAMSRWGLPPYFSVPWFPLAWGAAGALLFTLAVAVPTSCTLVNRACRR